MTTKTKQVLVILMDGPKSIKKIAEDLDMTEEHMRVFINYLRHRGYIESVQHKYMLTELGMARANHRPKDQHDELPKHFTGYAH